MKKMIQMSAVLGVIAVLSTAAAPRAEAARTGLQAPVTTDVTIAISDAYVPSGFDSGSDAFVVVNGLFPNTCYKWKEAVIQNPGATLHEIRSMATVSQGMCLMMMVPFTKEVQLGKLEKGNHVLRFVNGDGTYLEKQMVVE